MRAQEITFLKLVQGDKQFQVPLHHKTKQSEIYREQQKRLQPLAGDEDALHARSNSWPSGR